MRICIWGDSIAWGADDLKKGGWVNRLHVDFLQDYSASIYNVGISGDNSTDLRKRFSTECEARQPNIVLFAIGINDSQYNINSKENRVSIVQFRDNMKHLVSQAKTYTQNIIFIGLTNVDDMKLQPVTWGDNEEKCYSNEQIALYNKTLQDLAQKENISFIDLQDVIAPDEVKDGLHPNSKGHEKIYEKVKLFLLENFDL